MKKLLLLLLLPSLLVAGEVKVRRAEKIQQPVGTIDRVSKRTANSKTFEYGHIGSGKFQAIVSIEPIHFLDSTGVYQEFKFDAVPDSVSGFTAVRTGKFSVSYDTSGAIRWQKKDALLTITPKFDRKNVDIDFDIGYNGLKARYTLLNSNAPIELKWLVTANDTLADQVGGKGMASLKKGGKLRGMVSDFTALDAKGKPVGLTASYKKDSLVVSLDTVGAVFPITLDPTVVDSISRTVTATMYAIGATWLIGRNQTTADAIGGNWSVGGYIAVSADPRTYRQFLSFPMNTLTVPVTIDSAWIYYPTDGSNPAIDTCRVAVVMGTYTTATPATSWFNDFVGWAASGAYSITRLDSAYLDYYIADGAGYKSTSLTKAGRDSLKNHMGVDTLRVVLLEHQDIAGVKAYTTAVQSSTTTAPYLSIYYKMYLPGVTTVSDTIKAGAVLVGQIDSTGSDTPTIRGFKIWPKGAALAADTQTVSRSGSFGTGSYSLSVDSLFLDTLYRYKAFATSYTGTSFGAIDSFRTDTLRASTSAQIYVDGRLVTGVH